MTQAEALYHLQEIDLNLARIHKRLTEIASALSDNQAVQEAQKAVTAAQQILTPLQTKTRNLELEIQSNVEKIRQTNDQLYGGKVRNPKQLQEMEQEIQSLQRRNRELEDVLLETMVNAESAEAALAETQTQLEKASEGSAVDHQHLLSEQASLKVEFKKLQEKRQQALPPITEESLKTYMAMRPRKNNQPLALLKGGSCSACRVEQNMSIIGEARKGQKLTLCSSCGRILVYKDG